MRVETERVVLRTPEPGDEAHVAAFFRANADHLAPWLPELPGDFGDEAFMAFVMEATRREQEEGSALRFLGFSAEQPEGPVLGMLSLTRIRRGNEQACELSGSLDETSTRRGLATEAARAMLDFARDTLGLRRVDAKYVVDNARSAALLERLGFVRIGVAPSWAKVGGAWRDHVLATRLLVA